MDDHKQKWEQEHIKQDTFAVMHTNRPSQPVPAFVELLTSHGQDPASIRVLDLGCGKGRNALYLAMHGFRVTGVDFSERAIADARARTKMFQHLVEFRVFDLTGEWPFDDSEFDAIIDCNTSVFIPEPQRTTVIHEAFHAMKPAGYYLFYGFAEQEHMHMNVLAEKGLTAAHMRREAVQELFKQFTEVALDLTIAHDTINGEPVENTLWVGTYKKQL